MDGLKISGCVFKVSFSQIPVTIKYELASIFMTIIEFKQK